MASFRLTPDAIRDVDEIWSFIFQDNPDAADAVEAEIKAACAFLAQGPLKGHVRRDLTKRAVRFWTLPRYPKYIIAYRPDAKPLEIIRILHGGRDLKHILEQRP